MCLVHALLQLNCRAFLSALPTSLPRVKIQAFQAIAGKYLQNLLQNMSPSLAIETRIATRRVEDNSKLGLTAVTAALSWNLEGGQPQLHNGCSWSQIQRTLQSKSSQAIPLYPG